MSAGSTAELIRLMTAYDNSHEPRPAFNNRSTVYGLVIPFMVISYICVSLRLYYRIKDRCLGWDDLFVVLFRISATIGSIFLCLALNNGFGEHILTIGLDNIAGFQKKFYVALASYTISTTLMKLCLLSQYLRIFEAGSRARLICWAGLVISGLWGLAFTFCALFPCFPVSGFWEWTSPAKCYGFGSKVPSEIAGTFAGHAGSNVVLDAMVLAIPIPLYFQKSTAWRQRMGIGLLLLLGVIVNLISIWCLQTIVDHKAGTYPVLDPTWYGPKSITLAALEVDLASICASIPTFWPMVQQRFLGMNSVFVTREVHITHQHRRLSSDNDDDNYNEANNGGRKGSTATITRYELQPAHSRADSIASLGGASIARVASSAKTSMQGTRRYRPDDDFQFGGGGGGVMPSSIKEACVESQVQSDGQKGFEREQERLRLAMVESRGSNKR
ncbi:hypothetical protein F4821DRAFT_70632 [Hypoxylon rubiginosum]|uniref:Uncharacterized protein n=1 Tax=Hypoxylon rubiginosum TaxID=110542 RepID=A0ACC0D8D5_9PEZI|nr:hypothetical protein F4821DRAFT_70632 [Hypoxylon rubiginosum]